MQSFYVHISINFELILIVVKLLLVNIRLELYIIMTKSDHQQTPCVYYII